MSYPTRKVGAEFEKVATWTFDTCVVLDATPEVVFTVFENEHFWTLWHPQITSVIWTSEKPFQVGTTRTVQIGSTELKEYFYVWEPNKRFAFRFDATNKPTCMNVNAATEDYLLELTADGKTKFSRKVCIEPSFVVWCAGCLVRPDLQKMFDDAATNLQKFIADKKHLATYADSNTGSANTRACEAAGNK